MRAWKKMRTPPPTLQGLPAQEKLSGHNCSIWKIFYLGPILGAEMEFFAPNHLEERSLYQAQARASYTPPFGGSFAQHTPRHDIGCPTLWVG